MHARTRTMLSAIVRRPVPFSSRETCVPCWCKKKKQKKIQRQLTGKKESIKRRFLLDGNRTQI